MVLKGWMCQRCGKYPVAYCWGPTFQWSKQHQVNICGFCKEEIEAKIHKACMEDGLPQMFAWHRSYGLDHLWIDLSTISPNG